MVYKACRVDACVQVPVLVNYQGLETEAMNRSVVWKWC
jgi:hypothetical protein